MYRPTMGASVALHRLRDELGRGDERVLEGGRALAAAGDGQPADGGPQHRLRRLRVPPEDAHDLLGGDRVVVGVPAVVVGDHGERRVADLGLARELRLLQVGHADEVRPPRAVELRLGEGRELRPLHAHVGPAHVVRRARLRAGLGHHLRQVPAEGVREGHVGHEAVAEERRLALPGAVDELVGHDHVERLVALLERAHRGDGEDPLHAELLHGEDVGPEVELVGQDAVAAAVARQEGHPPALERADHQAVGGRPERGLDGNLADVGEALHLVEAGAPDDADLRLLAHRSLSRRGSAPARTGRSGAGRPAMVSARTGRGTAQNDAGRLRPARGIQTCPVCLLELEQHAGRALRVHEGHATAAGARRAAPRRGAAPRGPSARRAPRRGRPRARTRGGGPSASRGSAR